MTWWCVARGTPWDWSWQPYPGAWAFVLLVLGVGALAMRRSGGSWSWSRTASLFVATVALWGASDWPIAALGAGYLVSAHTVQYLLYAMVAPPLLLLAIPGGTWGTLSGRRATAWITKPLIALTVFGVTVVLTHLPTIVDSLMQTQLGSFGIDMAWFTAGLIVWRPAIPTDTAGAQLAPPLRLGYLFIVSVIPGIPAAFMTFADFPIYALYELAPRVTSMSALADQQLAGLVMKIAGFLICLLAMSVIFYRWQRGETAEDGGLSLPAYDS